MPWRRTFTSYCSEASASLGALFWASCSAACRQARCVHLLSPKRRQHDGSAAVASEITRSAIHQNPLEPTSKPARAIYEPPSRPHNDWHVWEQMRIPRVEQYKGTRTTLLAACSSGSSNRQSLPRCASVQNPHQLLPKLVKLRLCRLRSVQRIRGDQRLLQFVPTGRDMSVCVLSVRCCERG